MSKTSFIPLLLGIFLWLTGMSLTPVLGADECFQGKTLYDGVDAWKASGPNWDIKETLKNINLTGETCTPNKDSPCMGLFMLFTGINVEKVVLYRGCRNAFETFYLKTVIELSISKNNARSSSTMIGGRERSGNDDSECEVGPYLGITALGCPLKGEPKTGKTVGKPCATMFEDAARAHIKGNRKADMSKCDPKPKPSPSTAPFGVQPSLMTIIVILLLGTTIPTASYF